tara:strand:- start:1532 stop:1684 length:153 start_codon:yes stop_codon:yes gene_type:complete
MMFLILKQFKDPILALLEKIAATVFLILFLGLAFMFPFPFDALILLFIDG